MSPIKFPDENDHSIFTPFDIFEETYKTVSSHDIKAAVLVPKNLKPDLRPVIVNVHGGFFATAHSLFAPFFAPWAIELAVRNGAIIVSADYRLLPTPNGMADQLEDVEDFWQWTRTTLPSVLEQRAPGFSLDFSQLLLTGASAGGYYVSQLALSHPDEISVLAMAYPGLDLKDDLFVNGPKPGAPTVLRFPADAIPSKEDALAWVEGRRKVVATKGGFEITPYTVALCQHGDFMEQMLEYGSAHVRPEHLPIERLRTDGRLPKNIWIIHGDDDSVVYLRQSQVFVDLIREKFPETNLRFDIAKGQDHAFDLEPSLFEPYAEPAMEFVVEGWLH